MKKVIRLLYAHSVDMGGMTVKQPIPTQKVDQIDPFLLFHHHKSQVPEGTRSFEMGVAPHPHRGFSPVSFIYQGAVHHRDSRGNSAIVEAGGVQWMSAGMGIVHSERPAAAFAEAGVTLEIIQVWINTPAANKLDQPFYKAIQMDHMPMIKPDSGDGFIQLVSGEQSNAEGPIRVHRGLVTAMGELEAGSRHTFKLEENTSTILYLLDGLVAIAGFGLVEGHHLIDFSESGNLITVDTREKTRFLLLSAPPLREPTVTHGPFVMNNQTQILEAMRDYGKGKMGVLIEE